jgi:hypothetical protein
VYVCVGGLCVVREGVDGNCFDIRRNSFRALPVEASPGLSVITIATGLN